MEGEWSSFNGVCVNEEADFMAQLFPNPNNNVHLTYHNYSSPDSTSPNALNQYYFSHDQNTYTHVLSDHHHHHHHHQGSASNNASSSLPIDFLACDQMEGQGLSIEITIDDPVAEDKNSDNSSETNPRKRPFISSQGTRGRRNVRGRKREKRSLGGDEEAEEVEEEEDNDNESSVLEGAASAATSGGKTRASRGSATDPQSLYARKRRERINERLKVLQSLVPNGTKVDISTMLEEAVNYVKFLQVQIKLLSSDDHWMYAPIAYNGMSIGLDHFMMNNTAK